MIPWEKASGADSEVPDFRTWAPRVSDMPIAEAAGTVGAPTVPGCIPGHSGEATGVCTSGVGDCEALCEDLDVGLK